MKLYFVRHGQTAYNATDRISGQADIPLDDTGTRQARELAEIIPADITAIYSSDLIRCKQTAAILNERFGLPVEYDARLRERAAGSLEGKEWRSVDPDGEMKKMNTGLRYDFRPYGGESVKQVEDRVLACIHDIRARGQGAVLVVTSAGVIRLLHHLHHGLMHEKIRNGTVHEFDFE